MTKNEIRTSYLNFFKEKGHLIVPSAPVIPQGDPTLLFTNSGMNQFKDCFLGMAKPLSERIADSQKCIRVSGKHNDLEEVGVDTYHHTFFEMLGNWSFGNYYKKEAIAWAWELLTKVWGLPIDKLYATVYRTDNEAYDIWQNDMKLDPSKIMRFDEKANFWEMGDTGPCGPCSEIHMDLGPVGCDKQGVPGHLCSVNGDCGRYIEIWNLVFIQYNRTPSGELEELKNKHVDTGMGFERITSILQGKTSNYDTDIFQPIIQKVSQLSGCPYEGEYQIPMRVIADHLRTTAFSIADGVVPSNEGRGYVIRRVLRRAARYGRKIGLKEPFLNKLVDVLVQEMGDVYKELVVNKETIQKTLLSEEISFNNTLDKGLSLFEEKLKLSNGKVLSGADCFLLYDTYGFPFDLTALLARENNVGVDEAGFQLEMEKQRTRSRKEGSDDLYYLQQSLKEVSNKTVYEGENKKVLDATIVAILKNNKNHNSLSQGEEGGLLLDKTVCYGEGGGQSGDEGTITAPGFSFEVVKTLKQDGYFLHMGKVLQGEAVINKTVSVSYNNSLRNAIRKNHSATHLLQKALKEVLGSHVRQAGSLVTPSKLRFDFNHFQPLTNDEIRRVEEIVNNDISASHPVAINIMKKSEAEKLGALAFFDEKYGEEVRVVNVDNISIELCGGSHVANSAEIGTFRIIAETSSSAGVRRIEALTGDMARIEAFKEREILLSLQKLVQADSVTDINKKVSSLIESKEILEKQLGEFKNLQLHEELKALAAEKIGNISLYFKNFSNVDSKNLRSQIDNIRNQNQCSVVFFTTTADDKITLLCGVSSDITKSIQAGEIVKRAASLCGGGGGGRPDFAQAGGKDLQALPQLHPLLLSMVSDAQK